MNAPKVGTTKWIYRDGDVQSDYEVGTYITFKWHRRWQIIETKLKMELMDTQNYGCQVPVTCIKLKKVHNS